MNWGAVLTEELTAEASGRGVASVSLIEHPGRAPITAWVPPSDAEPRYLIYSVTKTFTAVLILRLCEEGRLRLDDSLARWFPWIAESSRMSVRQLLNHTAGIPDYGGVPTYQRELRCSPHTPWTFDRFAAETVDKGLLFTPGEGWSYSNPGFMLARAIAEEAGARPYRVLLADYIIGPLGLSDTSLVESLDDLASLAAGVSCLLTPDGSPCDVRANYHPGWVSHGVLASTCSDIVRFLDALFSGELLSKDSMRAMLNLVALPEVLLSDAQRSPLRPKRPGYGLGLMADSNSPWGMLVGHNGGGPCYSATAFHASGIGGVSVCAMGAIEDGFSTEKVVAQTLDVCAKGELNHG